MRAVRFARHGDPSVLQLDEVPPPRQPVRDELLVRVLASSVNGTDLGLRRGDVRLATWGRLPFTPGFDLAGEVVACGPQVTAFVPGDRVVALLGHGGGGLVERVLLRQRRAALAPASVSAEHAAALPLAGLTALQALHGRARLPRAGAGGARVLVVGAAGGIGAYAVQLARLAGAVVTATASGPGLPLVTGLGADAVVDHRRDDVRRLGMRFDVVLDAPGAYGWAGLGGLLAPGGVLVTTRPVGPDALRAAVPARLRRPGPRVAAVMTAARSQDLAHLAALVDRGDLGVPLDRAYPLSEAAEAHRRAEGPSRGKVVVTVAGG